MIRRRILVTGRVQGVFFRDSARQAAEGLGLSGSASNLADGRVEVVAEGPDEAVEKMIEWCKRGPGHASVDSIEVEDQPPEGTTGFRTN